MRHGQGPGPRLLLIGPLPPPVGGATVLFAQLVDELRTYPGLRLTVVDTSRRKGGVVAAVAQACLASYHIVRAIPSCDAASFHASRRGAAFFGPIVWAVCRLFRKPWIFRGFGDYVAWHRAGGVSRAVFERFALRADTVLFETKDAVEYFRARTSANVQWYANSRPISELGADAAAVAGASRANGSRFVFVGHVKPSKGIRELIEAAEMVDGATVDVYGPLLEGMRESEFLGKRTQYHGSLAPSAVPGVLRQFDALILPTYYEGEGYPGIILEAYAEGIPVISTRWRAIPEIVNERSGLLVEPGDAVSLAAAMRMLASPDLRRALRAGAKEMASAFSSRVWTDRFVQISSDLPASGRPADSRDATNSRKG